MIRDPSDGSVREEEPQAEALLRKPPGPDLTHESTARFIAGDVPSGLPAGSQHPKNIARLEASREWLKTYFHRKTGV